MRKILTILIAVLTLQGFSQEWAMEGALWHYTQITISPDLISYTTFESVSDTMIEGIQCKELVDVKRMYDTTGVYYHYMYSENDSVFFFRDGEFHLLYDFGAVEGDTIVLGYYGTAFSDSLLWIVDSISSIDINGEIRKLMYITCGDGLAIEFGGKVIEGIGNLQFMFPRSDNNPYIALRCYEDSDLGLFLNPYHPPNGWNFEECDEIITGIKEMVYDGRLSIYPNPFTTFTTIEYELTELSHVQLTIYNAIGETIQVIVVRLMPVGKHTFTWSPEGLPEGMYYGVLRSEEGVSIVKMLKQ